MSKLFVNVIAVALATGSSAFAASAASNKLMLVEKHSGFVGVARSYNVHCTINADDTLVERVLGGENGTHTHDVHRTIYTRDVNSPEAARALIARASHGRILKKWGATDLPTSSYIGIIEGDVVERQVKIYIDHSLTRYVNSEQSVSKALVQFADLNCTTRPAE